MKNATFFCYLLIIISTSLFNSCTTENVDFYRNTAKETITKAKWAVDYYFAGHDKTAEFNNYKFSFISNGVITADDGTNSVNGTWKMLTDINHNDVLNIYIFEVHLRGLSDQWKINSTSTGLLVMKSTTSEMRMRKL